MHYVSVVYHAMIRRVRDEQLYKDDLGRTRFTKGRGNLFAPVIRGGAAQKDGSRATFLRRRGQNDTASARQEVSTRHAPWPAGE